MYATKGKGMKKETQRQPLDSANVVAKDENTKKKYVGQLSAFCSPLPPILHFEITNKNLKNFLFSRS